MSNEIKTVTVPPCGHMICANGFMGCVKARREKMGVEEPEWEKFPPGSTLHLRRLSNTGFPQRDYEVLSCDTSSE